MDSTYTRADLAQVKQAIIDLTTGQRVTSISKDGRTVQFAQTDLEKLRSLERYIKEELAAADARLKRHRRTRTVYTRTSKGL